jgi:hypothetical protein
VSDPLELVAAVNPVRGPLTLDDGVRGRITAAVVGADPGPVPRRRLRLPVVPRVVAVALVMVAAGSAAAEIGVLVGKPSPPPVGTGYSYSMNITPDLRAGSVGWCVADITVVSRASAERSSCSPAPTPARPVVLVGGTNVVHRSGAIRTVTSTAVFITTASVAAVRVSNALTVRVTPRGYPQLPRAYGMAVALGHVAARRGGTQSGPVAAFPQADRAVGLNSAGEQIGAPTNGALGGSARDAPVGWSAHGHDLNSPPAARCEVSLPGASEMFGAVLQKIDAFADEANGAVLSCAYAVLSYRGTRAVIALLLDARRPGRTPPLIAGAPSEPDYLGAFIAPSYRIPPAVLGGRFRSAVALVFRRLPHALLVLEPEGPLGIGSSSTSWSQAGALLDRVRACVHLQGALCPAPKS